MTSSGRNHLPLMEVCGDEGGLVDDGAKESEGDLVCFFWDFW